MNGIALYLFSENSLCQTMADASLCFRCLACTSSPQLFLTFPELREHFPAAHSTSLQTEAVLLPSSLEALHCFLCSSSPFLKQEYLREHLRSHNLSLSQVNMIFSRGRKVCRICEQDVNESIEEHMLLNHSQDTFADESEIEEENINEENNLFGEDKAVVKQKDSDKEQVAVEVSTKLKQVEARVNSVPLSKEVIEPQYLTRKTCSTAEKIVRKSSVSVFYPSVEQIFQEADAKLLAKKIPNAEKLSRPKAETRVGKSRKPGPVKMSVDTVTNIPNAQENNTSLFKFCLTKPSKVNVVNALEQEKSASIVRDKHMNENHIEVLNTNDLESSYQTNHSLDNKMNKRSFTIKDVISTSNTLEKYRKTVDNKCEEFLKSQKLQKPFSNLKADLTEYGPNPKLPLGEQKLKIFKQINHPRPNPKDTKGQQLVFSLTPGQVQHDSTYHYVRRQFTSRGPVLTMYLQNNLDMTRFGSVVYQNEDVAQIVLQDGFFTFFVDGGFMMRPTFGSVEITVTLFPMV